MIRANAPLILIHAVANALLLWLAYEWLGVDESTTGKLLLSAVDALAILGLVCWLYGATFVWFDSGKPRLNEAFRSALRRVGPLLALAIGALILYGVAAKGAAGIGAPALKIASWLTWTIRRPVNPAIVSGFFQAIFWLLRWALLPWLLLPLAATLATRGRLAWRFRRRHLAIPVLALAGLWLSLAILNWKSKPAAFSMEMTSFVIRAVVAYALFLGSMIGITWASQSSPSRPQPEDRSVAPSPLP